MSFALTRQAIEARFATAWAIAEPTVPVKYQNALFDQPANSEWVALHVLDGPGAQASLETGPFHRYVGVIVIQIFVPENTGTQRARTLGDNAASVFLVSNRGAAFKAGGGNPLDGSGRITCLTPAIEPGEVNEGWFQMNVNVPYQRDVIIS